MEEIVVVISWLEVKEYFLQLFSSSIFIGLLLVIALDIITGKSKALLTGDVDSSIGTNGLIKHTLVILLAILVGVGARVLHMVEVSYIFGIFYIVEYITSIMENLDVLGIPFPESFKRYFRRMREENKAVK